MSKQNKYLEKIALTRVVKELAKGTLGEFGSAKAADSVYKLMQAGAIRSPKVYQKGLMVGNQEIAKKTGQLINRPKAGDIRMRLAGGHANMSYQIGGRIVPVSVIPDQRHFSKGEFRTGPGFGVAPTLNRATADRLNNSLSKIDYETAVRHELIEGSYSLKRPHIRMTELEKGQVFKTGRELGVPIAKVRKHIAAHAHAPESSATIQRRYDYDPTARGITGQHLSLGVLGREAEVMRKNPYQSSIDFGIHSLRKNETGEADLLKNITGKHPVSSRYSGKDLKKLEMAKPDATRFNERGIRFDDFYSPAPPIEI